MAEFPHYMDMVKRRKDVLFISREAWCRVYGKSREEFAEELSQVSGQRVSRTMTDHWLAEGDTKRKMPAEFEPYWEGITREAVRIYTRKLPQSEERSAMGAVDADEYQAWRWA